MHSFSDVVDKPYDDEIIQMHNRWWDGGATNSLKLYF